MFPNECGTEWRGFEVHAQACTLDGSCEPYRLAGVSSPLSLPSGRVLNATDRPGMAAVGRLCCKTILRIRARKIDSRSGANVQH